MSQTKKRENPLINIGLNVVIPTLIMTKLADDQYLGAKLSVLVAIIFPLGYGIRDLWINKKFNLFSMFGILNVLLTGGIGALGGSKSDLTIKETVFPLTLGIVVIIGEFFNFSFFKKVLSEILDMEELQTEFSAQGKNHEFLKIIKQSGYLFGCSFFLSAILNYLLADWILTGDPGTKEFTESIGEMTAYSYLVISIPMMIVTVGIFYRLFKVIKEVTGKSFEDLIDPEKSR